ncbi:MAG: hypothetical protein EOO73_06965 [Myxococcales bacterium]|nr:MAG: hypothetical protein EOO73_06965 [Myxococcales bacterium]
MRFRSLVWVAGLLLACGAKQEAKAPVTTPVASTPVAEEPPDLSPVKRPAEVVLVGRIARPRLFAETLTKWSSLPVRIEDLIPSDARPLAKAVLWEAPAELVVALDAFGEGKVPPPLVIGSIGLKSLDEALSAADALQMPTRKVAPGIYRVGDFAEASCAIAASVGAAPARLVCGRGNKDVDVLLPYATRGLASEPQSGADFELTLDAKPIQDHYGRDVAALRLLAGVAVRSVALDSPKFDRALSDAIYGAVDETINVFNDLDQVRIEARIDGARNVLTAATELKLKGETSWVAGTVAASKPGPVPATLPRLPPGATLACYNTALPAERYAAMSRILGDLAEGYLEYEKVPDATRKRVRRFSEGWLSKLPESFGFTLSPTQKDAIGARHADTTVVRISEPSPRIMATYTDLFGLLNDAGLRRLIKQKMTVKVDDKLWPKVAKKPFKLVGFKAPATLFELTADLQAWAALDPSLEKLLKELLPPPGSKELKRLVVIVQPEGDYTYVLTGDDPVEMSRVMAEHRKAEPGMFFAKPVHNDRVLLAGFMTLNYLARAIERSGKTNGVSKALAAAPNHGESPITFSTTTAPGSARADIEVPSAVFTDASAAVMAAGPALKDALKDH